MKYTYIPTGIKRDLVRFGVHCDRKGQINLYEMVNRFYDKCDFHSLNNHRFSFHGMKSELVGLSVEFQVGRLLSVSWIPFERADMIRK